MSAPPRKRRRFDANPYIDIEAAVDRDDQSEQEQNDDDHDFIDDESLGDRDDPRIEENMHQNRQYLRDLLLEDNFLESNTTAMEEEHSGLLREWVGLDLEDDVIGNPLEDRVEEEDDEVASVPRPLWAEIAHTNAAVAGALDSWQDDDRERKISAEDGLYEVSCQPIVKPGMEETIVFRIHSWAMQVDSLGPTKEHVFERSTLPNTNIPRDNTGSSGYRVVLARSAIANPYLRGRVYIESAKIGYVQRLARRVRGLNPVSVRPVSRDLLLRPLLMRRHSFPDRTFVRLLDPPCPLLTCLIVKDFVLMVPGFIIRSSQDSLSPADQFNADGYTSSVPPPSLRSEGPQFQWHTREGSDIRIDQYGFRYFPLKKLSPSSLEVYEPSSFEVELLFKYGRLNGRHYKSYMSRIMAYGFSAGDRVIFQAGAYDQLIGTVLDSDDNGCCRIYVPSQDEIIPARRQQLRRHFCIGDRVSATTNDVIQRLGSRIGWVVSASEGYRAASANLGEIDQTAGQSGKQFGYRVDLRVYSPESGKEVVAAHYEFQFEDSPSVSLHTAIPSSVSDVMIGSIYTLNIHLVGTHSFFGVITDIEGVRVQRNGIEGASEVSGTAVFSIWDKHNNAPFGYPAGWTIKVVDFSDFNIKLGDLVTLKDRDGRYGTARITNLGRREISLANFTGAMKISDFGSVRRRGPYDDLINKTVRVGKGPHKGGLGVVKTANTVGTCTVELSILPIRTITVNVASLSAVDQTAIYLSLIPAIAPPPRAQTPPAPSTSSDIPPAFQVDSADIPPTPPITPELDCSWLNHGFAQNMPIKLEPVQRKVQRPYHFSSTFYDDVGGVPRLMVRAFDRKKERVFPANELKWLPASDINQTVVRVTGDYSGTLYWTVLVDRDYCHVRHIPSKVGVPLITFPRLQLAQVNAKRS